uniref:Lipoprotein n=1 Tax=Arundo donax TaxID=35708 RepID=A0A0A9DQW6_ARUDO
MSRLHQSIIGCSSGLIGCHLVHARCRRGERGKCRPAACAYGAQTRSDTTP